MVIINDTELTMPFLWADMIPALIAGCTPKSSALTINPGFNSSKPTAFSFASCKSIQGPATRAAFLAIHDQTNGSCLRISGPM